MSRDATSAAAGAEAARLAALERYAILDTPPEPAFDEAVRLATLVCGRPVGTIGFVEAGQVWLKAAVGCPREAAPHEIALGARTIAQRDIFEVEDLRNAPLFRDLPVVRGPDGLRFHAGCPLVTPEGQAIGFLAVWDRVPGRLTPDQAESLRALGRLVMAQLNLRRRQRELEALEAEHRAAEAALRAAEAKYRGIFENVVEGIYQTTPDGRYLSANPMLARIYGYESPVELVAHVQDIRQQLYVDPTRREDFVRALEEQSTLTGFEAQIHRKDGSVIWISENARVVRSPAGEALYYEGTVQDITQRKQTEEALRHSEVLYHSLVENLPQNIFRKDCQERFTFANRRFCESLGRPREAIIGRTDFDFFPEHLARKYQQDDQRVMATREPLEATEAYQTAEGQVRYVHVTKTPLVDAAGQVIGIQGIFWDVTERKQIEEALAYERDLLRALLDNSPDIIFFKDRQSRFLKVGKALALRLGAGDPEDMVGRTDYDFYPRELAREFFADEQRILQTGEPLINKVERQVDPEGREVWASVTKVPTYNKAGEITGLVGVSRDITKLIETEHALREAEENYRKIFENSVEGMYQTTLDGRFLNVNPALARIYGYHSPQELMESLTDIPRQVYVEPGRREEFVRDVLARDGITGFESEIYRKDGSRIWVSESGRTVRDAAGNVLRFEGAIEDITARKQIETEREKARQAALESARLKSEFLANVSHEVRTPLAAIGSSANLILETRLNTDQRELASLIANSAESLETIVGDILDFSKIEAGRLDFEVLPFNLLEVVENTVEILAERAHSKSVELLSWVHPDVPRRLRGDPGRLRQVLTNLLGNAVKFTETGEVALEVEKVEETGEDTLLRFTVRDTGIGIPASARPLIFHAFTQADGSMARRYGGTGLGLAIARQLVERMQGHIQFESREGEGSTFWFTARFPCQPDEAPGPPLANRLAGRRALILDDNATFRRVFSAELRALGLEVACASTLDEARSRLAEAEQAPDFTLFDSELPGASGLEIARALRDQALHPPRNLVALRPLGAVLEEQDLRAVGIRGALAKPIRQSRLAEELLAIAEGRWSLGRRGGDTGFQTPAGGVPAGASSSALRVLLAEDNPVNQRVALVQLRKLGCEAAAAGTGHEVLAALRRQPFDLVLMDCQMPGLDGYETTRRIRQDEAARAAAGLRTRRLPIIALTANALVGDRDRGLEAGMDDYLTKPVRLPELRRLLQRITAQRDGATPPAVAPATLDPGVPPPPSQAPAADPVLDPAAIRSLREMSDGEGGDVLAEMAALFRRDATPRLERLKAEVAAGDWASARGEAHALKGSASNLGARRLSAAASELEKDLAEGRTDRAAELAGRVQTELENTCAALDEEVRPRPR